MKRERINQIAALVDKRGVITLVQLREFFPKVSEMTLRRDLFQLEEEGRLIRVRGGAKSVKDLQKTSGVPYAKNTHLHATEKRTIGAKAAELIEDGRIEELKKKKYESFESEIGKMILSDNTSLEELSDYALKMKNPELPTSGNQEYLQSIINTKIVKGM